MKPYSPRPILFHGLVAHEGWVLKRYTVTLASADAAPATDDWSEFARGRELAFAALPTPPRTAVRPGVGFVIEHRGDGADYVVLGWWDRENELPVRVMVRDQQPGSPWRPAGASESFCVWDLQVISFERDAYVNTMLARGAGDSGRDQYLAASLSVHAGESVTA
jgi:hypothetical protein